MTNAFSLDFFFFCHIIKSYTEPLMSFLWICVRDKEWELPLSVLVVEIHFLSIVDYSDCPFGNAHLAFDDSVGCSCVGLLWNHSSISFISSYFYLPVFRSDFCCCYAILGFVSVTRVCSLSWNVLIHWNFCSFVLLVQVDCGYLGTWFWMLPNTH